MMVKKHHYKKVLRRVKIVSCKGWEVLACLHELAKGLRQTGMARFIECSEINWCGREALKQWEFYESVRVRKRKPGSIRRQE